MKLTFPMQAILPNGRKLTIDHMTKAELTEMFRMIKEAARAGSSFTEEEYQNEDEFRSDVKQGDKLVVKDSVTLRTVAFLTLTSSNVCRSNNIRDLIFVIADWKEGKELSSFCGHFVTDYCAAQGHDGVIIDTSTVNVAAMNHLKGFGFKKVGYIGINGKGPCQRSVGTEYFFYDLRGKDVSTSSFFTKTGFYSPFSKAPSKL